MTDRDGYEHLTADELAKLGKMAEAAKIMDEHDEEGADGDERAADRSN